MAGARRMPDARQNRAGGVKSGRSVRAGAGAAVLLRGAGLSGLVLVGLLVGGVVAATAAQAHNVLRGTDPADGSTVAVAPDHVTLTFDEPALALGTEIEVRAPGGTLVSAGAPQLVDTTVTENLAGALPAGVYAVTWRVTSADGHPITGNFSFTATGATTIGTAANPNPSPSAAPAPAPSTSTGSSAAVVVAVIAVVAVAAAVIAWLLWRRRRGRAVPTEE